MDAEIVNVIIAVAVIYFVVKWATSGGSNTASDAGGTDIAKILGFRPKKATPDMIASVRAAFPDIPTDNIHYDLLWTGSVELTVNRLLERGYLDPPPAAYRRAFPETSTSNGGSSSLPSGDPKQATKRPAPQVPSLIDRFQLQTKVSDGGSSGDEVPTWDGTGPIPSAAKGKGRAGPEVNAPGSNAGVWEATPEQREVSLRKRKEAMILAARQRLLEKEAASKDASR